MKKYLFIAFLLVVGFNSTAQIGIGTTTPNASAQLDVNSTKKGFLPPRMSEAQKNAIVSPAEGLIIFQTDATAGLYFFKAGVWTKLDVTGITPAQATILANISGVNTGDQTNITGNAATVTTNANLTGPIKSSGNVTSVTSQTGTGSTFVMSVSPSLTTPILGAASAASIAVGTSTPNSSAILEASSISKGFLPPRMTAVNRNTIVSPSAGLMVWCTDCGSNGELQVYNGTTWTNMVGAAAAAVIVPSFTICTQTWMQKNLDVATYRNGDIIPKVTDPAVWSTLTTGAYCYYNNDSATYAATYGKLYNWYAVNDVRGLAPSGYHIPTDAEWTTLSTCLGGINVAGGGMKETGTSHWQTPNTGATNSSGFKALPGGFRNISGLFYYVGTFGFWWSATQLVPNAYYRNLQNVSRTVLRNSYNKQGGFSVRCVKD